MIRIGNSPTGVKLEVSKGDRKHFNHHEKYMVTFHMDHFEFTPESHSGFIKGMGTKVNKLPNGTLVIATSKIEVIDPWDKAMDYPYFKIDHSPRIINYESKGVISVYPPDELKPIRRSMGESSLGLPAPEGKKRTELMPPGDYVGKVKKAKIKGGALHVEVVKVTPSMEKAWSEFWYEYSAGKDISPGDATELKRSFCFGFIQGELGKPDPQLLSEVIEEIQREDKDPLFNNVRNFGDGIEPQRAPMDRQLRQLLKNQMASLQVMWFRLDKDGNPMAKKVGRRITETERLLDD